MRKEDVGQVNDIDRESFPTQWPPPNYQHELRNQLSHYIVVCDKDKPVELSDVTGSTNKNSGKLSSGWKYLFNRRYSRNSEISPSERHHIIGFSGFWVISGEAHISSIAVRESYRQMGIGELLLISLIEMAIELKARVVTLEVRATNNIAQSLYTKCGFTQVGVRKAYYIDNREDGIMMTTEDITSAAFKAHLKQLKQANSRKTGIELYQVIK